MKCQDGMTPQQLAQKAGFLAVEQATSVCDKDGRFCRLFVVVRQGSE